MAVDRVRGGSRLAGCASGSESRCPYPSLHLRADRALSPLRLFPVLSSGSPSPARPFISHHPCCQLLHPGLRSLFSTRFAARVTALLTARFSSLRDWRFLWQVLKPHGVLTSASRASRRSNSAATATSVSVEAFDVVEHEKFLSEPDVNRDEMIRHTLHKFLERTPHPTRTGLHRRPRLLHLRPLRQAPPGRTQKSSRDRQV